MKSIKQMKGWKSRVQALEGLPDFYLRSVHIASEFDLEADLTDLERRPRIDGDTIIVLARQETARKR